MKGVQCYELFGGIALKIHTFSFFIMREIPFVLKSKMCRYLLLNETWLSAHGDEAKTAELAQVDLM